MQSVGAHSRKRPARYDGTKKAKAGRSVRISMATDPVCLKPLNPHTAKGGMIWFKGAPFYFCSAGCKDRFEVNPARYASQGPVVPGVPHAP